MGGTSVEPCRTRFCVWTWSRRSRFIAVESGLEDVGGAKGTVQTSSCKCKRDPLVYPAFFLCLSFGSRHPKESAQQPYHTFRLFADPRRRELLLCAAHGAAEKMHRLSGQPHLPKRNSTRNCVLSAIQHLCTLFREVKLGCTSRRENLASWGKNGACSHLRVARSSRVSPF